MMEFQIRLSALYEILKPCLHVTFLANVLYSARYCLALCQWRRTEQWTEWVKDPFCLLLSPLLFGIE